MSETVEPIDSGPEANVGLNRKEVKWLEEAGFKQTWLEDNSGWWLERVMRHPILKNLSITVDRDYGTKTTVICVYAEDTEGHLTAAPLHQRDYSQLGLIEVARGMGINF